VAEGRSVQLRFIATYWEVAVAVVSRYCLNPALDSLLTAVNRPVLLWVCGCTISDWQTLQRGSSSSWIW
jgi:hypothetical protein